MSNRSVRSADLFTTVFLALIMGTAMLALVLIFLLSPAHAASIPKAPVIAGEISSDESADVLRVAKTTVLTKQVTYGLYQEPDTLNPFLALRNSSREAYSLVLEGVTAVDPDGNIYPVLATRVPSLANGGVSADGLVVTYTLRNDISWSDGTAFTCDDLLFTYQAIIDPSSGAISTAGYDQISSVTCNDNYTATVQFSTFYPGYYLLFSSILPRHATGSTDAMQQWSYNRQPIGTGPFRITEWMSGSHISLVKNAFYRDYPAKPKLDAVEVRILPSRDDGKDQISAGTIDILWNLLESDVAQLQNDPSVVIHYRAGTGAERLLLNLADPTLDATDDPLNNPHWALGQRTVRQAIQFGIDKQAIVDQQFDGIAAVGTSELSAGVLQCTIATTAFDPIQANALLDAAGWSDGNGDGVRECNGCPDAVTGRPLNLTIQSTLGNSTRLAVEQMLVNMMSNIGISLTINNVPSSVLFGSWDDGAFRKHGNYDILMYTTSAGAADPHSQMYDNFHSISMPTYANGGAGSNFVRWIDVAADTALEAAGSTPNLTTRRTSYQAVCDRIADDTPHIYLYDRSQIHAARSHVQGFQVHPLGPQTWNGADWYDTSVQAAVDPGMASKIVHTDAQGLTTTVEIPVGAVTNTTLLIYSPISSVATQAGFAFAGHAFALNAYRSGALLDQFGFERPVTITIHYNDADVATLDEDSLTLSYWDDTSGLWVDAATTCAPPSTYRRDPIENWLAVPICHLSTFALIGTSNVYLPMIMR